MMLKEKYCDQHGQLLEQYPSFDQFRYFYRKTKKMQQYYISRDGIKDYQRNSRPLLGDGVQQFAPAVGYGNRRSEKLEQVLQTHCNIVDFDSK